MGTGKKIMSNIDHGGWECYKSRDKSERDRCSDRMKGIRRAITKKCRSVLKRQLKEEIKNID